jgi:hypothetical protein
MTGTAITAASTQARWLRASLAETDASELLIISLRYQQMEIPIVASRDYSLLHPCRFLAGFVFGFGR